MKIPTADDIVQLQDTVSSDAELRLLRSLLYMTYLGEPHQIFINNMTKDITYPDSPAVQYIKEKIRMRQKAIEVDFWVERGFMKPEEE